MKAKAPTPLAGGGGPKLSTGDGAPFADGPAYLRAAADGLAQIPDAGIPHADAGLLWQHYGIDGQLATLSSEVERTCAALTGDGRRLILKTSSRAAAMDSFRFQSSVLAGLEQSEGVIAPHVIRTLTGELLFEREEIGGYLQSCVDGDALHTIERSPRLLHDIGAALARLNLAMAGLAPPTARRPVLWNIECWTDLIALQCYLPEDQHARDVCRAMEDYSARIAPRLGELDWQVTHNDPSPFNMIGTNRGIAFIDFGDGGWNPRLQDLAIAAGHFVSDPALPLGGAEHVIAGYASVLPLSEVEMALLPGLIRARQSALILINHWRANLFPDAAPYIMKNVHRAVTGLALLAPCDPDFDATAVRAAVALATP